MSSIILGNNQILSKLDELTKGFSREDIEMLMEILRKNEGNEIDVLQNLMGYTYNSIPVGVRQFVEDPAFLGLEGQVFPRLLDDLEELFEGDYTEAVLTGSIGWGKSTFAEISLCRMLYEISCLRDPQRVYGLMHGSVIALLNVGVTRDNARKVVFQGVKNKLYSSPYFVNHFPVSPITTELRFPNNIWVFPATAGDSGVIGYNVFGGVMDEVNFMSTGDSHGRARISTSSVGDQADALQKSLIRRMKSRFMKKGKLPGILLQISSSRYPDDYTERRLEEAKDNPSIFTRRYAQWDTLPAERWTGKRFFISLGDGMEIPRILHTEEDVDYAKERNLPILDVPIEFYKDFEGDIDAAIRDFAGRPTMTIRPYIRQRSKVVAAMNKGSEYGIEHPFSALTTTLQDGSTFLQEKLRIPELKRKMETAVGSEFERLKSEYTFLRNKPRYVHLDLSFSGDATGVAMGYIQGFKTVIRRNDDGKQYEMKMPIIAIELMLQVVPPKGGEIQLEDVRSLIYELRSYGYPIRRVTMDQFQSKDSMQQFNRTGIESGRLSADINLEVYNSYKDALYEDRLIAYEHPVLLEETIRLEKNEKKNKVDHPQNGSKDLADAVAGVCYNCVIDWLKEPTPPPTYGDMENRIQPSDTKPTIKRPNIIEIVM